MKIRNFILESIEPPAAPQWLTRLKTETMDGQRVEMGLGDVSFGEDQNTKADANGHKGHLSATVGNEPYCVDDDPA